MIDIQKYKFVDLFAGLGGFHLALSKLGCKCMFASELKEDLQMLYKQNFPEVEVCGDITTIKPEEIPEHDILCAGFPCQPFSQAGLRKGFEDEGRGNLFYKIAEILKVHKPKYVILENVSNLLGHDNGYTWKRIYSILYDELKYDVKESIISPHEFGFPQHRKRIYIVCKLGHGSLDGFEFPHGSKKDDCHINDIIDDKDINITPIKDETINQLTVWQDFIDHVIAVDGTMPSFPIWAMEFGATYNYEEKAPAYQSLSELRGKKGHLGRIIDGNTVKQCLDILPRYAQTKKDKCFPSWKIKYIRRNREFYSRHKTWLKKWLKKVANYQNSHLKLEWNCGNKTSYTIEDKIVQFRASGIRIKLPTYSPALNLVGTQIPIFPWIKIPENCTKTNKIHKGRYMTLKEASKIQGMQDLSFGSGENMLSLSRSYEALGNAINVDVVTMIAKKLLEYEK